MSSHPKAVKKRRTTKCSTRNGTRPKHLYSYVVAVDNGNAPNPFWGVCTLATCKPDIRRCAFIGDWVVGTGSKNAELGDGNEDLSKHIVYAMKVKCVMTFEEYDRHCRARLKGKIPRKNSLDYRKRMGDCIYDYFRDKKYIFQREGTHECEHIDTDLKGKKVLLSNHFYYFGEKAKRIPKRLQVMIKSGQKHKKIEDAKFIEKFENWIKEERFQKNKLYGKPQLKHKLDPEGKTECKLD